VADAGAWQQSYRAGGHQPWHLDARLTALSFASGFLGRLDGQWRTVNDIAALFRLRLDQLAKVWDEGPDNPSQIALLAEFDVALFARWDGGSSASVVPADALRWSDRDATGPDGLCCDGVGGLRGRGATLATTPSLP
jgi:hypothetical protein